MTYPISFCTNSFCSNTFALLYCDRDVPSEIPSIPAISPCVSPSTASGKLKRPDAEKIVDFVLGKFRPAEKEKLKKVQKIVSDALELILTEGKDRAMTEINSR